MRILAVDTSIRAGSLAILQDLMVLCDAATLSQGPYSVSFLHDCEVLLGQVGLSLPEIDLFAVAAGPGSFTGLRVGLTAVKGWAEVYFKPIAAVSALEAIAAAAPTADPGTVLIPVLDARSGQFYAGLYGYADTNPNSLQQLTGDVLRDTGELSNWVAAEIGAARPVFVTRTPDLVQAALEGSPLAEAQIEVISGVSASIVGRLGYFRALRGETLDAMHLEANYVRRTDAETKWKGD